MLCVGEMLCDDVIDIDNDDDVDDNGDCGDDDNGDRVDDGKLLPIGTKETRMVSKYANIFHSVH